MPSPFPGMDPYLEGYLWPDFHQNLAGAIQRQLSPKLRPQYVARLAIRVVQDPSPEAEVGIMYPDVEVLEQRRRSDQSIAPTLAGSTSLAGGVAVAEQTLSPALTIPLLDYEVRLVNVEIRDSGTNKLVTSIEILSPVNKRGKHLREYRRKRERLATAGVHVMEIDLLRRGCRPVHTSHVAHSRELKDAHYLISLLRGGAESLDAWPLQVSDSLSVVSVPLREPDADVTLDLAACFATVYEGAAYDLSIDYVEEPPPPAFDEETTAWTDELLQETRLLRLGIRRR